MRGWARQHPWLAVLSILGIATGVAVFVSIRLANVSASRAFELSTQTLVGNATHRLVGGPAGIEETLYARLRVEGRLGASAPVMEAEISAADAPARTLRLLGVDLFSERPFRDLVGGGEVEAATFLTEPGAVLISQQLAEALEVTQGQTLSLLVRGAPRSVRVIGLFRADDPRTRAATSDLVISDLSTAQELLGRLGRIDRVDLILEEEQARALAATLPAEVTLEPASAQAQSLAQLTRAFEVNLTALSLLALLVGMFLIYNTMTFSVVQRRRTLGTLRALGTTPGELFSLVLGDAVRLAIPGTVAGLAAGILLARVLVRLVAQTTNDLYFALEVREVALDPFTLLLGALLGLIATVLSALHPAVEAARSTPVTVLRRSSEEDRTRRVLPRLTLSGGLIALLGTGLLLWPSRSIVVAFAGLFAVLIGLALTVPLWTFLIARAARRPLTALFGTVGALAAGGVSKNLSRTSVAVAALTVSVATAVSVGTMVQSFRSTVVEWLDASLLADVYITAGGGGGRGARAALPPQSAELLREVEGTAGVYTIRTRRIRTDGGLADLISPTFGSGVPRPYQLTSGDAPRVWEAFGRGEGVLVSESLAFKRGLAPGGTVTLFTDAGPQRLGVLAVFRDYASNAGAVLLPSVLYERFFEDRSLSGIAVFAAPGTDVQGLPDRLRAALGDFPVRVQPTRSLKEGSLEVFDRTFTITSVLRLLALGVSFIGVFSALLAMQLERRRELALLRAIGLLPSEVWTLVCAQTALMGLMAGVLALPVGHVMAAALVQVINRRSFGWTLELSADPWLLTQAVLLSTLAAVLAGLYPAYRMARTPPGLALREQT